jgi:DNA polymerase-4
VGGDPSGRGVVAAANYEARKYGIHSALPAAQARRLCPETVFLRPDFRRYRKESQEIFAIYRDYTPLIQTLSLDEAYLDVSEHLGDFGSATAIATDIRRRVREERRLTVSVGVGPSKLVAKIASDFDKPDGLTVVKPADVEAFLAPLPVRRLHGVGPATEKALIEMGFETVGDIREASVDLLIARFGHWGRTMRDRAWGIDDRSVHTHHERKSLSTERTFEENLKRADEIDDVLEKMAREVAQGLEKRELAAATVTIKVRYPDFTTPTRSHTLPVPTADAASIASVAQDLVRRTDASKRSVRLLGVGVSNLVPGELGQRTLFEDR